MDKGNFAPALLKWYGMHKRDLPWRNTKNPYKIWLSEIILQQTRVQQGMPYYLKFVETYPTVQSLANAPEKDILRLWQGLGYYSRARNLHAAAKQVVNEYNGMFPSSYIELKKLKGVGDYTAAAIASFAFDEKAAVVDGNVFRVLARVFGEDSDIMSSSGKKAFQQLAQELLPKKQIGEYNQGIMEFGALHCKPSNPDCLFCPFTATCFARKNGLQNKLPVKIKKVSQKKRYFQYLLLEYKGHFLVTERKAGDIWQGLYDFPVIESKKSLTLEELWGQEPLKMLPHTNLEVVDCISADKHILSHQIIYANFFHFSLSSSKEFSFLKEMFNAEEQDVEGMKAIPKPILIDKMLKKHIF